jgi:hypothetical protein
MLNIIRVKNKGLSREPVEFYQNIDEDKVFLPIHPKFEEGKEEKIMRESHKNSHYVHIHHVIRKDELKGRARSNKCLSCGRSRKTGYKCGLCNYSFCHQCFQEYLPVYHQYEEKFL